MYIVSMEVTQMANETHRWLVKHGFKVTGRGYVTDLKTLIPAREYKCGFTRVLFDNKSGKWERSEQEQGVLSAIAWRDAGADYGLEALKDLLYVAGIVGPWQEVGA